jgi:hypothetical protein
MAAPAYHAAQLAHLEDSSTYVELPDIAAFTAEARTRLQQLLEGEHSEALGQHGVSYVSQSLGYSTPPQFYIMPKLHKMADLLGPIKGRPIAACHSWLTTHASKYLAHHLNKLLPLYPTILRDRWHLLRRLETLRVPADAWLVTFDVESLYPSIIQERCVCACAAALRLAEARRTGNARPANTPWTRALIALLRYVFNHSVVAAQGRHFRQTRGGAMGTNCMPPAAQLYLAVLWEQELQIEFGDEFPTHYWRYIDDGFFVWPGSESRLQAFLARLNNKLEGIRITFNYSRYSVEFLDLVIAKRTEDAYCSTAGGDGTVGLRVRTHQKPLNKYLYNPFSSHHPPASFTSFVRAELMRYAATCSDECWYDSMAEAFTCRLLRRGYAPALIARARSRVRWADRAAYIAAACAPKERNAPIVLALPYATLVPELAPQRVLHTAHAQATAARGRQGDDVRRVMPQKPITAFRRTPSLAAQLVKAKH